jgi:cellulose synthase/poly-beta-1,6-N-acetylglucosamine synthase-like glycosyltransferase
VALGGVVGAAVRRPGRGIWLDSGSLRANLPQRRHAALAAARPGACPEIDCVRHILSDRMTAAAEHRAQALGVGADRVLICADAITEEAYLTALAHSLGTSYEQFDAIARADCPLDDDALIAAAAAGLLPLRQSGQGSQGGQGGAAGEDSGLVWIIAPRGMTARRLADPSQPSHQSWPDFMRSFRLTSSDRLRHFVMQHGQRALGRRAADDLRHNAPLFSNAPAPPGRRSIAKPALAMLAFLFFALAPIAMIEALSGLICALFLAAAILRLWSACFVAVAPARGKRIDDARLPIYTIICALYREAAVVENLVAAIRALDYPPEKLDVKFVIEGDDEETRRALARLALGPPFEIITAPPVGPRTKPKALNVALPLARGAYTVVYDAEDSPEPDQLRRALDVFRASGGRLACVQASLTVDNTADNWLARMFTANYAGQFDVFLPGLAGLHLPFPLGGSSNHFRTAALRKVGAWDPYNVTEDADLGIRLYRLGYRSAAISSATYEEAPPRCVPWLKQRTRWYKGWMQTWLVHMRQPRRLWRELGPAGAIAFQIFFAANVLAALIHPLFMTGLGYTLFALPTPWAHAVMDNAAPIFATSLLSGYASTIVLDLIGLHRRGLLRHAWVLVLTPLHWFMLSLAAWRALFQLLYDPQRWEKTEHGLAKSSRLAGTLNAGANRKVLRPRALAPIAPIGPMMIMKSARTPLL